MSTPHSSDEPRIVRFFTPVRRIPVLIGKIGSSKLPFGPYTLAQLLIGVGVAIVGWQAMPLWGPLVGPSPIARLIALLIISVGCIFLAGAIPATKRKPHFVVADAFGSISGAAVGTYDGSAVRIAKPHQVTGIVLLANDEPDDLSPPAVIETTRTSPMEKKTLSGQAEIAAPLPAESPISASYETGLDRLLSQARGRNH